MHVMGEEGGHCTFSQAKWEWRNSALSGSAGCCGEVYNTELLNVDCDKRQVILMINRQDQDFREVGGFGGA